MAGSPPLHFALRLEGDINGAAAGLVGAIEQNPGAWAFWADGITDWKSPAVAELIAACGGRSPIAALLEVGAAVEWPSDAIEWVADASKILRASKSDHDLAIALGESALMLPPVRDLVIELDNDQLPPGPGVWAMLEAAMRRPWCYVYIHRDYPYRALLLTSLAGCPTNWTVRWR